MIGVSEPALGIMVLDHHQAGRAFTASVLLVQLNVLWACEASEASIAAALGTFLWPMTMTARLRVHADLAAGRHVVGVWLALSSM